MLGRMDSREITGWKAFFFERNRRREKAQQRPPQTAGEAKAVLKSLMKPPPKAKLKEGRRGRTR